MNLELTIEAVRSMNAEQKAEVVRYLENSRMAKYVTNREAVLAEAKK